MFITYRIPNFHNNFSKVIQKKKATIIKGSKRCRLGQQLGRRGRSEKSFLERREKKSSTKAVEKRKLKPRCDSRHWFCFQFILPKLIDPNMSVSSSVGIWNPPSSHYIPVLTFIDLSIFQCSPLIPTRRTTVFSARKRQFKEPSTFSICFLSWVLFGFKTIRFVFWCWEFWGFKDLRFWDNRVWRDRGFWIGYFFCCIGILMWLVHLWLLSNTKMGF